MVTEKWKETVSQTIADARGASRNELDFELSEMDDEMAEYVAQALEDDWEQQLQESWFFLEVSFNDFGSRGAVAFAKAIGKQTTHLIEFESFTNHITSAGAVAIAQHCLAVPNCRLGGLNLDDNPIESEGVVALANALATNTTLLDLILPRWLCRDAAQALPCGRTAPCKACFSRVIIWRMLNVSGTLPRESYTTGD